MVATLPHASGFASSWVQQASVLASEILPRRRDWPDFAVGRFGVFRVVFGSGHTNTVTSSPESSPENPKRRPALKGR